MALRERTMDPDAPRLGSFASSLSFSRAVFLQGTPGLASCRSPVCIVSASPPVRLVLLSPPPV